MVSGGPSWKPLPFVFTTVWGLFGSAAPTLWVITARAGGLLGLVGRLAAGQPAGRRRLGRRVRRRAGRRRRRADPGLVLLLAARHLRGGPDRRLAVGGRPAARRPQGPGLPARGGRRADPARVVAVHRPVRAVAVVPRSRVQALDDALLLLAGPVLRSRSSGSCRRGSAPGKPFLAATHAAEYNGHLGSDPFRAVRRPRQATCRCCPALVFAVIAVAIGWLRDRNRVLLAMGVGIAAWWVVVVAMTLDGYPGLERFFLPAAALTCVLGGVGVVRWPSWPAARSPAHATAVAVAVAAILVLISIPFTDHAGQRGPGSVPGRLAGGHDAQPAQPARSRRSAATTASSRARVELRRRQPQRADRAGLEAARDARARRDRDAAPGVDFIGPHNGTDGGPAPVDPRLTRDAAARRRGRAGASCG